MKLILKTLQRDTFEVEIDEALTVLDLKKKVEEVRGAGYAAQNLKLIYAGKILSDEKLIKDYDITAFIVVMVSKPKPAPVQSTEGSTSAAATTAATPAATTTTPAAAAAPPAAATPAAPTATPTTTPATTQQEPTGGPDNMFVSGPEYEAAVTEMINMGFERTQIERAMTASFMNPHRAIEYLFNPASMPVIPAAQPAAPAAGNPPAAVTAPAVVPPAAGGDAPAAGNIGNLDFLRNQPQLHMLRQMIAQDPQMLQSVLEELGQANPQLLQAIQANPQQFINLLHEGGGAGGGDATTGAAPQPPPPGTVQITPAEKAAIDRIKALGFPEHLVVQAYFACEKNENLAAEFLFSENLEDEGT